MYYDDIYCQISINLYSKKKKKRFNANNAYTIFNCEVGRNENLEIFYDINIIKIQMYCY